MRRLLNWLYHGTSWLAALSLLAIAVLVVGQIIGRMFGAGALPAHHIAGFFLVASLFLALAHTFGTGEHVRITIVIEHVGEKACLWMEMWCLAVGAFLTGYFAYFSGQLAWESWLFNEQSDGLVAVPLWIPQGAMVLGISVFFIRLVDELVQLVRTGKPRHLRERMALADSELRDDVEGETSGEREG